MLRPEQMSKVSVTGSKRVMDDVVEAVHDSNLLHVTEYDGAWEGFEPGNPIDGAEAASEKLVTVRSIESILDVDGSDAGPTRLVTDEALEKELAEIRDRVNELEDRRDEVRSELGDVEERLSAVEPFATLGIDLDLLSGYDSLEVVVGEGDRDELQRALVDADGVDAFDLFGDDVVAVFVRPAEGAEEVLTDALVGVDFTTFEVPDAEGSPEEYVAELEHRQQQLESRLRTVEDELDEVKLDAAGFLLAAEEKLAIDVQKREAPLSFATTDNAFVAEGWIPTDEYTGFAEGIRDAVGDHVEVEELERATFDSDGGEAHREDVTPGAEGAAAADGGADEEVRADGGGVVMRNDSPPVVQNNPGLVEPFEVLTGAVSRPKYEEFDPTVVLFLTFPAFFGFMIGDLGYGALYTLIGYYLYSNFESDAFRSMGGVTIFAGLFTMLFGVLYGEIFGTHFVTKLFWEGLLSSLTGAKLHAPLHKGLQPAYIVWAQAWLVISVLAGIFHLNVGWTFDFVENAQLHDLKHAVLESGSWLLMLNGLWVWVFSKPRGVKPDLLFTVFEAAFGLPFTGFGPTVGTVAISLFGLGLLLLIVGEPVEAIEFLNVFVNVLSYTRIAAVLLAKAGMAFTVNLLFFGAYATAEGEFHFMYGGHAEGSVLFEGLMHMEPAPVMLLLGLLVLVFGHLLVLGLGVTSAGLQAVRLEYVEFFGKFYEGGGRAYEPFGYEREYTTDD
ncbi:MAG: V-type ATP synthase subunit I [Haloarculaceae archaeon]